MMKKCKCKFKPPHPIQDKPSGLITVEGKSYPQEFFCNFCTGVITNDSEFIKEVVKYHAGKHLHLIDYRFKEKKERKRISEEKRYLALYQNLIKE